MPRGRPRKVGKDKETTEALSTIYSNGDLEIKAEQLVAKIIEDYENAKNRRSKWEQNREEDLKYYLGNLPQKDYPWKDASNLHIPATAIVKDTIHASIMKSFFSNQSIVSCRPVSEDDIKTARKREQFLNYQADNEIGIYDIADQIADESLISSMSVAKPRYERITKQRYEIQSIEELQPDGTIKIIEQKIEIEPEVLFDGIKISVPDICDIFYSEDAKGHCQPGEAEFIIHRTNISKSEYLRRVEENDYMELDFKHMSEAWKQSPLKELREQYIGIDSTLRQNKNTITLLEWYGEFYNEKTDKPTEIIAVVALESGTLCKAKINDTNRRPFVFFKPYPVKSAMEGQSLPGIMRDLQQELNTLHNQRVDQAVLAMMPPGFYRAGGTFDPTKYEREPGGMYPVEDPRDVTFQTVPDAPMSGYREETLLWNYIERRTAASEGAQGMLSNRDRVTAREFQGTMMQGTIRFELLFKRYNLSFQKLFEYLAWLNQEFMPEEKEFRILGSDGRFRYDTISKQEMNGKLDIVMSGSSVIDDAENRQRAQVVYEAGMKNPLIISNPVSQYEHLRYLYESVGVKNIDRLIPKPPQAAVRTPQEEHNLLYKGQYIEPDMREDAQNHLLTHEGEMGQIEFKQNVDPQIQQLFKQHADKTRALIAAQMKMQQTGSFQQIGTSPFQPNVTAPTPAPGQAKTRPEQVQ